MKRSFFIRMIALAASIALLAGALVVAAVSGSPYETLKDAIMNLGELKNHSLSTSMTATLDGVVTGTEYTYDEYVDGKYSLSENDGYVNYRTKTGSLTLYGDSREGSFYTNGGEQNLYSPANRFDLSDEDPRYVRLAEMAIDMLVGDLKNNISMTQTGEMRHISGTLTASQIPEIYNLAFDILMSEAGGSYIHISDALDMSTFDAVAKTIVRTEKYISGSSVNERTYEYELHEFTNEGNQLDSYQLNEIMNGSTDYGIYYINGAFYELWNSRYISSTETPLDEATYLAYADMYDLPPIKAAKISYVHGEADVDNDGLIRSVKGSISVSFTDIFGKDHELEVAIIAEITPLTQNSNARYEKMMNAVAAYAPDKESYYNMSFVFDAYDNITVTNIYNGRDSFDIDGNKLNTYPTDIPADEPAYPADEMAQWVEMRVIEMAEDPVYADIDFEVLQAIAQNEWLAIFENAA